MKRLQWLLALPVLILAASAPSMASEIRDKASLFSAEAVKKAESELTRIEREYKVPVEIETVQSLDGVDIDTALAKHAKAANAHGLYILIAKKEHKTEVGESRSYAKYLTKTRTKEIRQAINEQFANKDFDAGLAKGIDKIDSTLSEARTEAGGSLKPTTTSSAPPIGRTAPRVPGKPSTGGFGMFWIILIGILAVFLVLRVLGALLGGGNRGYGQQGRMMGQGGPGYGQPGYGGGGGGGGGGFMSSMFGGIGGALAGNWLYDQFSGRHHDSSMGQSNYDPGVGSPETTANDDFVTPGDGGGDWGGGGDAGGGDWGGGGADAGGGGDWGGGGGGGDWGGGGGDGGGDW